MRELIFSIFFSKDTIDIKKNFTSRVVFSLHNKMKIVRWIISAGEENNNDDDDRISKVPLNKSHNFTKLWERGKSKTITFLIFIVRSLWKTSINKNKEIKNRKRKALLLVIVTMTINVVFLSFIIAYCHILWSSEWDLRWNLLS